MNFLPISQDDLKTCAERWGWEHLEPRYGSPRVETVINGNHMQFFADENDWYNASAILDRISHLARNGGSVTIFADLLGFSWWDKGQPRRIDVPAPTDEAPNMLSWILMELTKALPPEVWQ